MKRSLTIWPGAYEIVWDSEYTLKQSCIRWALPLLTLSAFVSFVAMAAGGGI